MPCSITCATAVWPDLRSIAIACIRRTPDPTTGIHVSSLFSTHTWRGNSTIIATVSQDEECFHKATWQPSGSGAPSTRWSSPQLHFSTHSTLAAQARARGKRRRKGRHRHTMTKGIA